MPSFAPKNNEMRSIIFISAAFSMVALVVALMFVVARRRYRKIIREKDISIIRRLHEQDRLARELENVRNEKEVLEKTLIAVQRFQENMNIHNKKIEL
jgi:hypothetical protein